MSRASRIPYLQNCLDLLNVVASKRAVNAAGRIRAWQRETDCAFPAVLEEWYATAIQIPTIRNPPLLWRIPLLRAWHEFTAVQSPYSLNATFDLAR